MARTLDPKMLDILLLGPGNRRRQLQDLPVLGDVWTHLATKPDQPPDLLIVPTWEKSAAEAAKMVRKAGEANNKADEDQKDAISVAYLNGLVVATLRLEEIIALLLPATRWWDRIEDNWRGLPNAPRPGDAELIAWLSAELRLMIPEADWPEAFDADFLQAKYAAAPSSAGRLAARLGLLLGSILAARTETKAEPPSDAGTMLADAEAIARDTVKRLTPGRIVKDGAAALRTILDAYDANLTRQGGAPWNGLVHQVTLNRPAEVALHESVPAIKGDAARTLFSISCRKIAWAVLDSGIDHQHPAFWHHQKVVARWEAPEAKWDKTKPPPPLDWYPHRIKGAFNFQRIRAILGAKQSEIPTLAKEILGWCPAKPADVEKLLAGIIADRKLDLPVDWRKVQPLIELDLDEPKPSAAGQPAPAPCGHTPTHAHGTHVAGIVGADWQDWNPATGRLEPKMQGVCPDIHLYDCRVLGSSLGDSEFAVTAAIQFIRFYNEQGGHPRINGANMSLSIRHNVRNYACGRTPVCIEAEALSASGVVVVAAAGNHGYKTFQLADASTFEGYAASSITDPGNADNVITVGSTHRAWPHTYGVSFFSSRGPTGDGRLKPDLLAPGEKISSCTPGGGDDEMDGTSMAAPHVSGAAALLMARHDELRGRPARVKEILCATATDLKRDRSFQGHGMVDVLRAIQSL